MTDERPVRAYVCTGCGTEYESEVPVVPDYGPNAQDVIDALRLVLTQDDAQLELVRLLVDAFAPA